MSVLIFLGVLFVLILVHEWGHYITAKWTGMRVDEFGIGFPPRLFSWRRGETVYTLNALPIGGFVKILGENGEDGEVLSEGDQKRTFSARPKWAQALVLIAGVTMNVILAWLLFYTVLVMGAPTAVSSEEATEKAELTLVGVLPQSPASVLPAQAVFEEVSINGETITPLTPERISSSVSEGAGAPVTLTYRDGEEMKTTTITPVAGIVADDPERFALGVQLVLVENVSYGPVEAIKEATLRTYDTTIAIVFGLYDLLASALMGEADFSQVAGPVGIVEYVGDAAAVGLTSLLIFTAIISLNLAVINLLPIPALDGGRLVFVAIESITRRPINPVWSRRLNITGFVLLMLLMLAVTFNDIINLVG